MAAARAGEASDAPEDTRRRAIVIDDSGVERLLAVAMLNKLGLRAEAASNAADALALLARTRYALALCDISLPGTDGLALLSALRSLDADLRCVMQSSHDDPARKAEALRRGASAYLVKPLRLAQLAETLRLLFPDMAGMHGMEGGTGPA